MAQRQPDVDDTYVLLDEWRIREKEGIWDRARGFMNDHRADLVVFGLPVLFSGGFAFFMWLWLP